MTNIEPDLGELKSRIRILLKSGNRTHTHAHTHPHTHTHTHTLLYQNDLANYLITLKFAFFYSAVQCTYSVPKIVPGIGSASTQFPAADLTLKK